MGEQQIRRAFNTIQLDTAYQAVSMSEELVSNYFKMSANQWLKPRYDVKTLCDLNTAEIVDGGPFAQIIRYQAQRPGTSLGSESYDFYKICLQDHTILAALNDNSQLCLLPFCLYIIIHELVHIVRFSRFLQHFEASAEEKLTEERRVHRATHDILAALKITGIDSVLDYFHQWRLPLESLNEH